MNKISRRSTFLSLLAVLGLSCPLGSALAQASNNAPFEMVVLFPAGSSADVGATGSGDQQARWRWCDRLQVCSRRSTRRQDHGVELEFNFHHIPWWHHEHRLQGL